MTWLQTIYLFIDEDNLITVYLYTVLYIGDKTPNVIVELESVNKLVVYYLIVSDIHSVVRSKTNIFVTRFIRDRVHQM